MQSSQEVMSRWQKCLHARLAFLDENMRRIPKRHFRNEAEQDAYDILLNEHAKLVSSLRVWGSRKCHVRGCALCCHFPEYGTSVQLDLKVIPPIRAHLEAYGRRFEDYVIERRLSYLPQKLVDFLPEEEFVFVRNGEKRVYEVKRGSSPLGPKRALGIPRQENGNETWLDKDCRPCVFLEESRCTLFAAGISPMICSGFICSTSAVLGIARQLGYITEDVPGDDETVRKLADRALRAFGERLLYVEAEYAKALMSLCSAYASGDDIREQLRDYNEVRSSYLKERRRLFEDSIRPS